MGHFVKIFFIICTSIYVDRCLPMSATKIKNASYYKLYVDKTETKIGTEERIIGKLYNANGDRLKKIDLTDRFNKNETECRTCLRNMLDPLARPRPVKAVISWDPQNRRTISFYDKRDRRIHQYYNYTDGSNLKELQKNSYYAFENIDVESIKIIIERDHLTKYGTFRSLLETVKKYE